MRDIDRVNLGFIQFLPLIFETAMAANSLIKTIEGPPSIKPVTIPGILAEKGIGANIIEQINKSKQELEAIHQTEIELAKKQEEIAKEIAQREALKQKIMKIAPWVVIVGVGLGIILLISRRKK